MSTDREKLDTQRNKAVTEAVNTGGPVGSGVRPLVWALLYIGDAIRATKGGSLSRRD